MVKETRLTRLFSHATPVRLGRCIRRLVTLRDRVEDLVNEADRRACLDESELESQDFSEE